MSFLNLYKPLPEHSVETSTSVKRSIAEARKAIDSIFAGPDKTARLETIQSSALKIIEDLRTGFNISCTDRKLKDEALAQCEQLTRDTRALIEGVIKPHAEILLRMISLREARTQFTAFNALFPKEKFPQGEALLERSFQKIVTLFEEEIRAIPSGIDTQASLLQALGVIAAFQNRFPAQEFPQVAALLDRSDVFVQFLERRLNTLRQTGSPEQSLAETQSALQELQRLFPRNPFSQIGAFLERFSTESPRAAEERQTTTVRLLLERFLENHSDTATRATESVRTAKREIATETLDLRIDDLARYPLTPQFGQKIEDLEAILPENRQDSLETGIAEIREALRLLHGIGGRAISQSERGSPFAFIENPPALNPLITRTHNLIQEIDTAVKFKGDLNLVRQSCSSELESTSSAQQLEAKLGAILNLIDQDLTPALDAYTPQRARLIQGHLRDLRNLFTEAGTLRGRADRAKQALEEFFQRDTASLTANSERLFQEALRKQEAQTERFAQFQRIGTAFSNGNFSDLTSADFIAMPKTFLTYLTTSLQRHLAEILSRNPQARASGKECERRLNAWKIQLGDEGNALFQTLRIAEITPTTKQRLLAFISRLLELFLSCLPRNRAQPAPIPLSQGEVDPDAAIRLREAYAAAFEYAQENAFNL